MNRISATSLSDVVRSFYGNYEIGSTSSRQVTANALSQNVSDNLVKTSQTALAAPISKDLQNLKLYVRGGIEKAFDQRGTHVDLIS